MRKLALAVLVFVSFGVATPLIAAPATEKSVKTLLELSGTAEMGVQMMNQLIPSLKQMAPGVSDQFWIDFMSEVKADEFIDLLVPIYQKHFTEQDIQDINEFYNSPVGKKMVRTQPQIMQEGAMIGQQWGLDLARRVEVKYQAASKQ